ncbi:MAG: hypothetical protein II625_03980 [Bacilli bacterium]|nr:hypothetical protein [Bacilli bacterium]
MKSKLRFNNKRGLNFISVFLLADLLLIFGLLKTSNAIYVSDAIGEAPLDVALYAFNYDGLYDTSSGTDETALDINLGDIAPGAEKLYRFKVTNKVINDEGDDVVSDTNIIYRLKVITTTNINLKYSLYYNQNPRTAGATDLFKRNNQDIGVYATDGWGTWFKHYAIDAKCLKKEVLKEDEYYLKVEFPEDYKSYLYQDMVESIKIQLESKQVIAGDSDANLCN